MRRPCSGLAALGVVMGCQTATPPKIGATGDEAAVRAARAAQNEAIAARDLDRIASYWTDDVEIRRGLGPLVIGRGEYRRLFAGDSTRSRDSVVIYQREPNSVEISAGWPLAYESGTWAGHLGRGDGPVVIGGRYAAQWVKRDGRWLIRGEVYVALSCADSGCSFAALP